MDDIQHFRFAPMAIVFGFLEGGRLCGFLSTSPSVDGKTFTNGRVVRMSYLLILDLFLWIYSLDVGASLSTAI